MKFASPFDLVKDADAVLDLFDGVDTTEQMISRLNRLRHGETPANVLELIENLREAVAAILNDTIELDPSSPTSDDFLSEYEEAEDPELTKLSEEPSASEETPASPQPSEPTQT